MKTFYATFGCGSVLGDHILKLVGRDESHVREQLEESRLLTSCIAFIYPESEGLRIIEKWKYTVINGKLI